MMGQRGPGVGALLASKGVKGLSTMARSPNLREPSARSTQKLIAFLALVGTVSLLNYAGNLAAHPKKSVTENAFYHYSTAISALVIYGIMFLFVCWIAGWHKKLLAFRQPKKWLPALGLAAVVLLATFIVSFLLEPILHAGREQGALPDVWKPQHAAAYAANWIVVAGVAPFVEESTYRGLGYSLFDARWGKWIAIIGVGVAFGLSHGLVQALPVLIFFGSALAWLRSRVDSVYPGMLVHSAFNSLGLAAVFFHH
jgi:membrane protease YdiL (CAAX protease family)